MFPRTGPRLFRIHQGQALPIALLVYGALNAILYSGLLPLWEGFDEPFHYGYVQWLRTDGSLPVLGKTPLPAEIMRSLDLVPVNYAAWQNLHRGVPFDVYERLSESSRVDLRNRLEHLASQPSSEPLSVLNYEAHQAPLAYAVLAPFDRLWADLPLTGRILRLRLLISLTAVLLLWLATTHLSELLKLPPEFSLAALFIVFSSQMFYATVCHVANDWLAIPVWILLVGAAATFCLKPTLSGGVQMCAWLTLGLLTKAYFLTAVPFVGAVLVFCRLRRGFSWRIAAGLAAGSLGLAGPWYARNVILYRNLAGMQETSGGIPAGRLAAAALHLPWLHALDATARSALWTGNNSLIAFSSKTTCAMIVALAGAAVIYLIHASRQRLSDSEGVVLAGLLCFAAGLVYSTVLTFWYTRGAGISPAPWYLQPMLAPGMCLLFLGLSQFRIAGSVMAIAILWLWSYAIGVTYIAKLVPLYAGFTGGRAHLAELAIWWQWLLGGSWGTLDTAALLAPRALILLTGLVVALVLTLAVAISVVCWQRRRMAAAQDS